MLLRTVARGSARRAFSAAARGPRRPPPGGGGGRRNNNNNNNNNNRAVVRGPDYEEPSASAATSIIYRIAGALGACTALGGYLYFVYNPGMGDRRFGAQKQENDEYFERNDNYDGEWDRQGPPGNAPSWDPGQGASGGRWDNGGGSSGDGVGDGDSGGMADTYDPYAQDDGRDNSRWDTGRFQKGSGGRNDHSHEAHSRSTWAWTRWEWLGVCRSLVWYVILILIPGTNEGTWYCVKVHGTSIASLAPWAN